jgi:hypothetical protein
MERAVECTHCKVVMTSWSAAGSPIRYYQCPFCARTHSSLYGEVFRSRAGARVLDAAPAEPPPAHASGIPMASAEDIRWAGVKQTAARWFARLEADGRRNEAIAPPVRAARPLKPRAAGEAPELDPDEVIEVAPSRRAGRR